MAAILRSGRVFEPEALPQIEYNDWIASLIPFILSFWSTF